ncbi:MAG TPA: hypothetical protein VH637_01810 [Streptosporangiaceae bacterium]
MGFILGDRHFFRTRGRGSCHCERCGGDRHYRSVSGRRWLTVLMVPVLPLERTVDHLQCTVCGTRYRLDLLALPTVAQMQAALPAGTHAAAVAMLRAGDPGCEPARHRAVETIRAAGLAGYDDAALEADLARQARPPAQELARALNKLATQLIDQARSWFLADVVRIGLAGGGPLTQQQRTAALQIGTQLGIGAARARAVIELTEQARSE